MRQLLEGIHTWAKFNERKGYDFNGFFAEHPDGNLVIDPVEPDEETLEELARLGVARILLTNRNHVRATETVRQRTGALVAIHPADAEYARGQGATLADDLDAGATAGPFRVVPVPGKSPGEVALYWPERRLLVVGDAVIGNPPGSLSLLPDKVMDDPPRLRQSVSGLLTLDFDVLLLADGEPMLREGKDELRKLAMKLSS